MVSSYFCTNLFIDSQLSIVAHGPGEAEKCYSLLIKEIFRTSRTYTIISAMTLASDQQKCANDR